MAKEVLAKIQAAEAQNAKQLKTTQATIDQWQRENEEKLAEEKAASQAVILEAVEKRQAVLLEEQTKLQASLFSNQQEAQLHYENLYARNKAQALQLVLEKVRESYGS